VAIQLNPDSYRCPDHETDLTDLVVEQLEERVPVTFRPRRPEQFRVLVTCPGTTTGGHGQAATPGQRHEVACAGHVRY
jgi:hypothetical protein